MTVAIDQPTRTTSYRYVRSARSDVGLAFLWVPFAIAAWVVLGNTDQLQWLIGLTLLFSFLHQPLTLPLVYGDHVTRAAKRRIFLYSPIIIAVGVIVAMNVSFTMLAVIAGVWNAGHTLQQRYGITRIYGRKAQQVDGRTEHWMLWSWLILAFAWASADTGTPERITESGMGGVNKDGLDILTDLAPITSAALPFVIVGVVALIGRWAWEESRRDVVNPMKWLYLASTATLFAVMLVSPIVGFVGYVGSHAAEYFYVVHNYLHDRYPSAEVDRGAKLGRVVRARPGPFGFLVGYFILTLGILKLAGTLDQGTAYRTMIFTAGALHLWYDGFIWKLRRPEVARGFQIDTPAST